MRLFVFVFVPFFLSGCFYQSINSNDIENGTKICENRGSKVQEIQASFSGSETVVCTDRMEYWINSKTLNAK